MNLFARAAASASVGEPFALVRVERVAGSAPRDAGAAMLVLGHDACGTIGGGHLEWKAIEQVRALIGEGAPRATLRRYPLGPALGQCCGGVVELVFVPCAALAPAGWQRLAAAEAAETPSRLTIEVPLDTGERYALAFAFAPWTVAVFGAGHVGRALVTMLSVLPCRVRWIDERPEAFPATVPPSVEPCLTDAPEDVVGRLPAGTDAIVTTHSHALDLTLCLALAARDDLGLCGLIGSATKAARFRARIAARAGEAAADRIICPVGDRSIASKHPGMVAASIVAQLAARRAAMPSARVVIPA